MAVGSGTAPYGGRSMRVFDSVELRGAKDQVGTGTRLVLLHDFSAIRRIDR